MIATLDRALVDEDYDELFDAGLDDTTPATEHGIGILMVTRSAESLVAAIVSVVENARIAGFVVTGVKDEAFAGSWGEDTPGKPSLNIESDGRFSGTDGCNRLIGKGTISGHTFTFGTIASTRMACEGIITWLNLASTATLDGTTLVVFQSIGAPIGTLAKQ